MDGSIDMRELSRLESELRQLKEIAEDVKSRVSCLKNEYSHYSVKIDKLARRIERIKQEGNIHKVSDHAVLRYLERVQGLDIEAIRENLRTNEVRELSIDAPSGTFIPHRDNFIIVVRDGVVVTVIK